MSIPHALALSIVLLSANGHAPGQNSFSGSNPLNGIRPPHLRPDGAGGAPLANVRLLTGVVPQKAAAASGGGNVVCSRFSGNCWINNGVALNGVSALDLAEPSGGRTLRSRRSQPSLEQRLDPTAVRLMDGAVLSTH